MNEPAGATRRPTASSPGRIRSVITYLEMTAPPGVAAGHQSTGRPAAKPSSADVWVELRRRVSPAFYRTFYRRIGESWLWWERLQLDDVALAGLLMDPGIEIRLLQRGPEILGYSELDRRDPDDVELAYFGLIPDAIGKGFGRFLMNETLKAAWSRGPRRVWLHTCSEDHPCALAFYRTAGFRSYRVEEVLIDDPRHAGLLPPAAAPHVPVAR